MKKRAREKKSILLKWAKQTKENFVKWRCGNVGQNYKAQSSARVTGIETCFGKKPEGYNALFVFIPKTKQIIRITEGCGDNLLLEDIKDGYVDYIYYEQYELDVDMPEVDGGQILLKELFREKYRCTADCIQDVLSMAYGSSLVDCMILNLE